MKAIIELTRTIHQQKKVEIELSEEQIEDLCISNECKPTELTYEHIHYAMVDNDHGDKLALDEDGWVDSKPEQDKKDWDGCCDKLIHDDGSVSEYNFRNYSILD
jgi:hypothetical protein